MSLRSAEVSRLLDMPLNELCEQAAELRDAAYPGSITYSPKVFIPLTRLCRDVCHYCTFATTPSQLPAPFLSRDEVVAIAAAGRAAGCREALFTLGDRPEERYPHVRRWLTSRGFESTVEYLADCADAVLIETGLLPHINAGVLTDAEYAKLRPVCVSVGLMLESTSTHLCQRGRPHYGSPDKQPAIRIESLRAAGRARLPTTTGILIGIGETREEILEALLCIRELHAEYGHVQEVIVQNFVPKHGTKMSSRPAAPLDATRWALAAARHVLDPRISIQVPPNLNASTLAALIDSGLNDWGGVSPVTPDHVNPESPWPDVRVLAQAAAAAGRALVPRLAIYPPYIEARETWLDAGMHRFALAHADAQGLARTDAWTAGRSVEVPACVPSYRERRRRRGQRSLDRILTAAGRGATLAAGDIVRLFAAQGGEVQVVAAAADALRRRVCGDDVTYVVNCNINYTNICRHRCGFCAFSKGRSADSDLRGPAYLLSADEVAGRAVEAETRGATEVCMQGGIHPSYTGETYLDILRAVRAAAPRLHVHAFSPLEVQHGARSLGLSLHVYLERLRREGLGSLPGTAAEILDDDVRRTLCPDKLRTNEWLAVVAAAHQVGLRTTATIMFGHVDAPIHWARHLLAIRALQERTGGFTEFVPLPFVHMESPLHRKGLARPGPTWRETLLMHSVARLALHPVIGNVQVSWVKAGRAGAAACLEAGANDLGGGLMSESISRAAGASHGQHFERDDMITLCRGLGRIPRQRTTLYAPLEHLDATPEQHRRPNAEERMHA